MRKAPPQTPQRSCFWTYGVWPAPFAGPNGELVLIAITSEQCLYKMQLVPANAERCAAADALWAELEKAHPPQPIVEVRRLGHLAVVR